MAGTCSDLRGGEGEGRGKSSKVGKWKKRGETREGEEKNAWRRWRETRGEKERLEWKGEKGRMKEREGRRVLLTGNHQKRRGHC